MIIKINFNIIKQDDILVLWEDLLIKPQVQIRAFAKSGVWTGLAVDWTLDWTRPWTGLWTNSFFSTCKLTEIKNKLTGL